MGSVLKISEFTQETKKEVIGVLSDAFIKNQLVGGYFFKYNKKKTAIFMEMCADYYIKAGTIYGYFNDNKKLVGVSLWSEPNSKTMNVENIIKCGLVWQFLLTILKVGIPTFVRLVRSSDILEKYHIKEPHCYLFMLASVEKGAGYALCLSNLETYKDETIYIESSVVKDNHSYYRAFGGKEIGEAEVGGVSNMFFIIQNKNK